MSKTVLKFQVLLPKIVLLNEIFKNEVLSKFNFEWKFKVFSKIILGFAIKIYS